MVGSSEITDEIRRLRREHNEPGLHRSDLLDDPFDQFSLWLRDAIEAELELANSMTLATADRQGRPSARVVLLKGVDDTGFVFFTNYESKKARDLDENPWASLVFYWSELSRQVRVDGRVERVSEAESVEYFLSRSRGSQIGAWASKQSQVLPKRSILDDAVARYASEFEDDDIPKPPFWGGYRLLPDRFEFWQGRPSRLHDRFRYKSLGDSGWQIDRLSP
ncbi:MAG: pyridoxamine 5'-phosphate oxidase [Chloroflexota bacterium]